MLKLCQDDRRLIEIIKWDSRSGAVLVGAILVLNQLAYVGLDGIQFRFELIRPGRYRAIAGWPLV
jgi:hypothetical protein